MTNKNRFYLKQFAGNANNNGQFGSYQEGTKLLTSDPEKIQELNAWEYGWNSATSEATTLPRLEEMQALEYVLCKAIINIHKTGISLYNEKEEYTKGSIVSVLNELGEPKLFCSIKNNNINHSPETEKDYWDEMPFMKELKKLMDDFQKKIEEQMAETKLGLPDDDNFVDFSVGTSGTTYTAIDNGFIFLEGNFTTGEHQSSAIVIRTINNTRRAEARGSGLRGAFSVFFPISKDQQYIIDYVAGCSITTARFFHLK